MGTTIYTSISERTLTGARDRVLDNLNALTDGNADKAITYVKEFLELDKILREHAYLFRQADNEAAQTAAQDVLMPAI